MLDEDLAEIYGIPTGRLNEQVKRNVDRFPTDFMFQLSKEEWENLKSQNAISSWGGRRKLPLVFTEQGVAGLSGVIKSEIAVKVHVAIMRAFVALRKMVQDNQLIISRLDRIELKQLETDQKFDKVFKALENKDSVPSQGIFFDGQVFDAYELASRIIRSAKKSIILIDKTSTKQPSPTWQKKNGVQVSLLTKTISKQLELDIRKANAQHGDFDLKPFDKSHDRFLIIDGKEIYHLGASLKDLGKRWFAFSKLERESVKSILLSVSELLG